ncbi:MAG: transposase [Chitinophagales bacterium]
MKANVKQIRKKRIYSVEFKKQLVLEFEKGKLSVPQMEKLYGVHNQAIYNWIYKYSTFNEKGSRIIEMKNSATNKLKLLEQKVRDLERMVGQKQIKIDYLEKMMEIAKEELDIDIKKNFDTPQSTGSEQTKKK